MATTFLESGTDATQDTSFFASTAGSPTSATDQVHTGKRSLKLSIAGGGFASAISPNGVCPAAGTRMSLWFRTSRLPASGTYQFMEASTNGGASDVIALRLGSTGKIDIDTGGGTVLGAGTIAISANTWTRVCLAFTITNTTTFTARLFINGVLAASAVNSGTLLSAASSVLALSIFDPTNAVSLWYDDIYIDDSSSLTDTGDIRVTAKRPNANGTTNGFSTQIGAGGSGYGTGHSPQVNEQPLSVTNGWSMIGAGSAVTEEYNVENASTGDVFITSLPIVDFMGWVYAKAALAETGQIVVDSAASNISLTSTNTMFIKAAGKTTYPAGTGTDIGIVTDTTVTTVSLYECGILMAYKFPAGLLTITGAGT